MSAATDAPAPAYRRVRRRWGAPLLFLLPAALLFVAFLAVPIGYALYLSFRGMRVTGGGPFGLRQETWVGLDNYVAAFTDPELVAGLGRLGIYGIIAVPLTLVESGSGTTGSLRQRLWLRRQLISRL